MTNEQIIADVALANGLYTEEQIIEMMEAGEEIPLHTVQGWKARFGTRCLIKKGEHGIETRLWKKKKKSQDKNSDKKEEQEAESESILSRDFYLAKSYLFTREQVIVIDE